MTERDPQGLSTAWLLIGQQLTQLIGQQARIEWKIDRLTHCVIRINLQRSTPRSRPSSAQPSGLRRMLGRPLLSWVAERALTIILAYMAPLLGGMWLLGWRRVTDFLQLLVAAAHGLAG